MNKKISFYQKTVLLVLSLFILSPLLVYAVGVTTALGTNKNPLRNATVQVIQLTDTYKKTKGNKTKAYTSLKNALRARKTLVLKQMENDPGSVLDSTSLGLDEIRKALPKELASLIETRKELVGKIDVIHIDDFVHEEKATYLYSLLDSTGKRYLLNFSGAKPQVLSGTQVKVNGLQLDNVFALDTTTSGNGIQILAQATTLLPSARMKKIAVIMVNFEKNPVQLYSSAYLRDRIFTSATSTNKFYQEDSFGKLGLTGTTNPDGDFYGWYTIPNAQLDPTIACDPFALASAADSLAKVDGFVSTNYNSVVYEFPNEPLRTLCYGALGTVGGSPGRAWLAHFINPSGTDWNTAAHELGHTFGLQHSNAYTCTDASGNSVPLSDTCKNYEYGDPYDIMGAAGQKHMNNYQKDVLGFFAPSNILDATTSGTYTIAPVETPTSNVQSIRIPYDKTSSGVVKQYFYLEYRTPYGFDTSYGGETLGDGILVRIAPPISDATTSPHLLYLNQADVISTKALAFGSSFYDPVSGITIKPLATSSLGASVQVTLGIPTCIHRKPTINSTINWFDYTIAITNNDSFACLSSNYTLKSLLPSYLTQTPGSGMVFTIPAGETVKKNITITAASGTPSGIYAFAEIVQTGILGNDVSLTTNYQIGNAYATTSPASKMISPLDGAILSGIVPVSVTSTSTIPISSVFLMSDTLIVDAKFTAPYTFNWDTTQVLDGLHQLYVWAHNTSGNISSSPLVNVTVLNGSDTVSPSTVITSPGASSTVVGSVTVYATAFDNIGVNRVELWKDGTLLATDTSSPYSFVWNTTLEADGPHSLYTKAYDGKGNVGTSVIIPVSVANNGPIDTTPPLTAVSSPLNGASVSEVVTVSISASDNGGLSKFELWKDGTLFATSSASSPLFTWNTLSETNGIHILQSKAYDVSGNIGISSLVSVTVSNAASDTISPSTVVISPLNGALVSGAVTVNTSSSDNVGVSKVELWKDGTLLATDASTPYTFTWNTLSELNGIHTLQSKAYDVAGNVGISPSLSVTVNNVADVTPPSVTVTNPLNGTVLPKKGSITVSATASDPSGISLIEISIDTITKKICTLVTTCSYSWAMSKVVAGPHLIVVKATDNATAKNSAVATASLTK